MAGFDCISHKYNRQQRIYDTFCYVADEGWVQITAY